MTQNIPQQQTMSELLKAIENNDICSVKKHLPSLHIEEDNSLPLLEAIKENSVQIVDELIPYCLTANNCATVMNTAIAYWRGELLKTLIATPVFQNNIIEGPLLQAVRRGQTDNVKLLIPLVLSPPPRNAVPSNISGCMFKQKHVFLQNDSKIVFVSRLALVCCF